MGQMGSLYGSVSKPIVPLLFTSIKIARIYRCSSPKKWYVYRYWSIPIYQSLSGWWCNNHLETYEFVNGPNGKDEIPYIMEIKHVSNHQPVINLYHYLMIGGYTLRHLFGVGIC